MLQIIANALQHEELIIWKEHALLRMRQRKINVDDILEALAVGSIVERYSDDNPYPSMLVSGKTLHARELHMVIAVNESNGEIYIVAGYEPDPSRWNHDFSRRLKA